MKIKAAMFLAAIVLVSAGVRAADNADDIISLTQKGVGEEVLMATVENSKGTFELTTADIIKLKENKVPDKVVAAMIKHRPGARAVDAAVAAQPRAAAPLAPRAAAAGDGVLNIENLDDKTWSYMYEPEAATIWISRGNNNGRGNLEPHGGLSLRMPAGTYAVRYNGRNEGANVTVNADDKSLIMLTRVETAQLEALYVTVFEKGERKSGGRLVTLRENGGKKSTYNDDSDDIDSAPATRVVERERYVDAPSTTVVYRDAPSVIYSGYYPSYSYYGGYASPRYYGSSYYGGYYAPRYYGSYGYRGGYGHYGHGHSHHHHGSYYGGSRYGYSSGGSFGFGYRSGGSGYRSGGSHRGGFSVGIGARF